MGDDEERAKLTCFVQRAILVFVQCYAQGSLLSPLVTNVRYDLGVSFVWEPRCDRLGRG